MFSIILTSRNVDMKLTKRKENISSEIIIILLIGICHIHFKIIQ